MKLKSFILSIALTLAVSGLVAQYKYEYAEVGDAAFSAKAGKIYVSRANDYQEIDYKIEKGGGANHSALIQYIEKMESEGWEVFSVESTNIYHLRKKKNQ